MSSLICTDILKPPTTPTSDILDLNCWYCAWSPNGSVLASCHGKRIFLWSKAIADDNGRNASVIDSPKTSEGKKLNQWRMLTQLPDVHDRTVRCAAFSPCGTVLASASFDGTVAIYEQLAGDPTSAEWECTAQLEGHENEVKHVCWNSNGTLLATCGRDKAIWIWECVLPMAPNGKTGTASARGVTEFECIAILHGHTGDVKSIVFGPSLHQFGDGDEVLYSTSYDDEVRVWAEDSCGEWYSAATLSGHRSTVWAIAIASGGARLITASDDQSLGIWKCYTATEADKLGLKRDHKTDGAWKCVGILTSAHKGPIYNVHCPSARAGHCRIASVGADDALNIYREVTGTGTTSDAPLFEIDIAIPQAHSGDINCVRWNPRDGSVIATAGDDGVVRIWCYDLR